jgi:hypothetical protein
MYAGYPSANTVPYAAYIEEGTKPHTIKAKKTIHFVGFQRLRSPPKYARGRRKYSTKAISEVFISGKGGRGGVVKVKGIKPVHFMRQGAQYILRNMPNAIQRGLGTLKLSNTDAQIKGASRTMGPKRGPPPRCTFRGQGE